VANFSTIYSATGGIYKQDPTGSVKVVDATYANLVRISPNEQKLAFAGADGQMIIYDIESEIREIVSPKGSSCYIPQWSPDSEKILFASTGNVHYVYDLHSGSLYTIEDSYNACWSPNSDAVVFYRSEQDQEKVLNTDIWICLPDGQDQVNLTNTADICEMDPAFISENEVVYHTYVRNEICKAVIDPLNFKLLSSQVIYGDGHAPDVKFFDTRSFNGGKTNTMVPGTVPYIHQVYDTPDWHSGSGSCAPTTAMMAIAYFNKLPKWPITSSWPTAHTSNYGNYVAEKYRFNEVYYSDVATTGGGDDAWGGYGYMWTGSYSPNSRMSQYMNNHQLASNQHWTTGCVWDSTVFEINHGWPQPICSMLTGAGHLTLAIGYVNGAQHTLIFNDPYGDKNLGYMNYSGQNSYYDWPGDNNGYQNLNSVAWTVKADGVETTYCDTLIDDIDYDHGFYMFNQPPSQMRYYRDETSSCYNGHYWWTYTNPSTSLDTCWVSWTPTLAQTASYEVSVYIPGTYAMASTAKYHIYYNGGDTLISLDQSAYGNVWVSLGTYPFLAGSTGYVRLGDATGIQGEYMAFDAMKWQKVITTGIPAIQDELKAVIFPNPVEEDATLILSLPSAGRLEFTLNDATGRQVYSQRSDASAGTKQWRLPLSHLASGTYILHIEAPSSRTNITLIKK
jgi:hypothetical protein